VHSRVHCWARVFVFLGYESTVASALAEERRKAANQACRLEDGTTVEVSKRVGGMPCLQLVFSCRALLMHPVSPV
jgi:hypothetical protein